MRPARWVDAAAERRPEPAGADRLAVRMRDGHRRGAEGEVLVGPGAGLAVPACRQPSGADDCRRRLAHPGGRHGDLAAQPGRLETRIPGSVVYVGGDADTLMPHSATSLRRWDVGVRVVAADGTFGETSTPRVAGYCVPAPENVTAVCAWQRNSALLSA